MAPLLHTLLICSPTQNFPSLAGWKPSAFREKQDSVRTLTVSGPSAADPCRINLQALGNEDARKKTVWNYHVPLPFKPCRRLGQCLWLQMSASLSSQISTGPSAGFDLALNRACSRSGNISTTSLTGLRSGILASLMSGTMASMAQGRDRGGPASRQPIGSPPRRRGSQVRRRSISGRQAIWWGVIIKLPPGQTCPGPSSQNPRKGTKLIAPLRRTETHVRRRLHGPRKPGPKDRLKAIFGQLPAGHFWNLANEGRQAARCAIMAARLGLALRRTRQKDRRRVDVKQ